MLTSHLQSKTAADWARLPEGYKYQLIAGEFVEWSSMTLREHDARMEVGVALNKYVEKYNLGEAFFVPLDVHLTDRDIYQPDIIFVSNEHSWKIEEDGVHGAPDLIIEVLSPSTSHYDRGVKKDAYERAGAKEYWIIDPMDLSIEAFVNSESGFQAAFLGKQGQLCSSVLPEFCIETADIFDV